MFLLSGMQYGMKCLVSKFSNKRLGPDVLKAIVLIWIDCHHEKYNTTKEIVLLYLLPINLSTLLFITYIRR